MSEDLPTSNRCYCLTLPDLVVVPMGGDGQDERVFCTLENVREHGGQQWWLYLSACIQCLQSWMVAQDERIYDNYYLRRLSVESRDAIVEQGQWPDEFITYERVLKLGRTMTKPWTWLDPRSSSLVWTAEDLKRERPDISIAEIADLLAISEASAARLLRPENLIDRFRRWARTR